MTPWEQALIKAQEKIKQDIARTVADELQSRIGIYGKFEIGLRDEGSWGEAKAIESPMKNYGIPAIGEPGVFFTTPPVPLENIPTIDEILETVEEAREMMAEYGEPRLKKVLSTLAQVRAIAEELQRRKGGWGIAGLRSYNDVITTVDDDDVKPDVVVE